MSTSRKQVLEALFNDKFILTKAGMWQISVRGSDFNLRELLNRFIAAQNNKEFIEKIEKFIASELTPLDVNSRAIQERGGISTSDKNILFDALLKSDFILIEPIKQKFSLGSNINASAQTSTDEKLTPPSTPKKT